MGKEIYYQINGNSCKYRNQRNNHNFRIGVGMVKDEEENFKKQGKLFMAYGKWKDQTDQTKDNIIKRLTKEIEALKGSLSNIDNHINRLNKESIDTNTIVKKTLDSWLEEHGIKIIKEYVRKFKPSEYMKMKFKQNEERIKTLELKHTNSFFGIH